MYHLNLKHNFIVGDQTFIERERGNNKWSRQRENRRQRDGERNNTNHTHTEDLPAKQEAIATAGGNWLEPAS